VTTSAPALHRNRLRGFNRFVRFHRCDPPRPWLAAALAGAALGLLAMAGPAAAAPDPACKPVIDAMEKGFGTPSHLYTTRETVTGANTTNSSSESIYADGGTWILVHGQWRKSPVNINALRTHQTQQMQNGFTCHHLRDEAVGGDMTAVYGTHQQSSDSGPIDTTVWISKASGLPVKTEADIDISGTMARAGKVHQTTRYEYTNVHSPAGAQ
jgi:hypothetical protein